MLNVKVIPVLEDNYLYLFIKEHMQKAMARNMTVPKRGPGARSHGAGIICDLGWWCWVPTNTSVHLPTDWHMYSCPAPTCSSFSDPSSSSWHLDSTAQQMYQSLAETLGICPKTTGRKDLRLYPKRGGDDMPTVPSTLGEELLYNPFLRVV